MKYFDASIRGRQWLKPFEWAEAALNTWRKGDARKLKLAWQLDAQTIMPMAWIAHLGEFWGVPPTKKRITLRGSTSSESEMAESSSIRAGPTPWKHYGVGESCGGPAAAAKNQMAEIHARCLQRASALALEPEQS